MRFRVIYFLISALVLVRFPKALRAQSAITGGLTGVVTDPSGAIVPNAVVELQDNRKGDTQSTTTNGGGEYLYSFLRPGSYVLTVAHPGFRTTSRTFYVSLGPPGTLNIELALESSDVVTVRVTDEVPLLNRENGDVSTTISQLQISQIPNPGNDLTYVAQIAPGMIMNTDGGFPNYSSFGMPGTSNLLTINGMSYNDLGVNTPLTGALNLLLGTNQIQEATVVSEGYSGTFGSAAGTHVNFITKSGGDSFHGNATYYWNGRVLNANDWISNASQLARVFDNANQWGASFGGPIKRKMLFFFFDTEGVSLMLPAPPFTIQLPSPQFETATLANIDAKFGQNSASDKFYRQIFNLYNSTPGANTAMPGAFGDPLGCYGFKGPDGLGTSIPCTVHFTTTQGSPSNESFVSGRIDWNLDTDDRVFLLVQYDHGHQASYLDPISPLFDISSNQPWWQGQLSETHSFGANGANQVLAAGWWFSAFFGPKDYSKAIAAFPTTLAWNNGAFTTLGGFDNTVISGSSNTQYQISDDFVKTSGAHKLGFGVSFLRADWSYYVYVNNAIGQLIPQTLDAFYQGGVDPGVLAGTDANPDYTILNQSFYSRNAQRMAFYQLGIYAQDEWHVRPALTLTLALRAEHQSNPVCRDLCFARLAGSFESVSHDPAQPYNQAILIDRKQAYSNMDNLNWSPRVSFAWQPFGVSRNTVIRGGVGVFYDRLPGSWVGPFSSNPPLANSFTVFDGNLTPDETTSLFKTAAASNQAFLNGFAAGQTLAQMQATIPDFVPPSLTNPDNVVHSPQYQKWDLEIQEAFGAATSLSVGYYGNHGIHEVVVNPSANTYGFGPFPGGLCTSPPVPPCADPRFGQVTEVTTPGISNYNGMVVSFQHRFTGWSQGILQANYTFSHALDEVSNGGFGSFTSGGSQYPQNPYDLRGSYGPAEYDVRHSLNANYVWELPVKALLRGHGSDHFVKGWQISGTIFARTGFPYTVFDYNQAGNLAIRNFYGSIYAVPVGPLGPVVSCGKGAAFTNPTNPCQPPQVLADGSPNPSARFVQAGCEMGFDSGTLPSESGPCGGTHVSFAQGRNRFRGPSYFDTDFSIMKNTRLPGRENVTLGMGIQMFNAFNHPNFGIPDNGVGDSGFGQIFHMAMPPTSILGSGLGGDASPRMIQIRVQLQF
jgi:hypothetical protein